MRRKRDKYEPRGLSYTVTIGDGTLFGTVVITGMSGMNKHDFDIFWNVLLNKRAEVEAALVERPPPAVTVFK